MCRAPLKVGDGKVRIAINILAGVIADVTHQIDGNNSTIIRGLDLILPP